MFCRLCGKQIPNDSHFCPHCGTPVIPDAQPEPSQPNVSPSTPPQQANPAARPGPVKSKPDFFSKEHLFAYEGRRGRFDYFLVNLFWGMVSSFIIFTITRMIHKNPYTTLLIVTLLTLYPYFCNMILRVHDLNHSTGVAIAIGVYNNVVFFLWSLSSLLWPFGVSALIISLYLTFARGTRGPNQYGEDPLA
jgi:uncharacterized membrane protein YhaH (DUF805 family)